MQRRRRFNQFLSLQDRLSAWADTVRKQALALPAGAQREALLKKAHQADTAIHLNEWANSSGLQPPK
jgi:hypothetical protein